MLNKRQLLHLAHFQTSEAEVIDSTLPSTMEPEYPFTNEQKIIESLENNSQFMNHEL